MNGKEYKLKVIEHFKHQNATKQDWTLFGQIMLHASENRPEMTPHLRNKILAFDERLLTAREFRDLYGYATIEMALELSTEKD